MFENPKLCLCIGKTTWKIYAHICVFLLLFPVYTSVTKQQLAETKIKFFDITNEEYARAETYKSLALEMDKK
jgi:hypothetical protein